MSMGTAEGARRLRGRRAQAEGDWFEQMIENSAMEYESRGLAVIDKTPEPMKVLRPVGGGQFLAVFKKMAQPDFKGTLKDGTTVLFDAKHTDTDKLQQHAVTSEQARCFERYEAMGAQCFIVANIGFKDYYRVPWDTFKDMKKLFGHLFMTREELEPYRIQYSGGFLRFLDGLDLREREET